jgi:catechol-2,3-dioxygenase
VAGLNISSAGAWRTPPRIAHFVIRTNRFAEMRDWYVAFFRAQILFDDGRNAFLTFDEEHHRLALINDPSLRDSNDQINAIDHVAFSLGSLEELLVNFEHLKAVGIKPLFCVNHGITTSIYYRDPNGNKVEMQVDNFKTALECKEMFNTDAFRENVVGVPFDANILLAKLRAGVPVAELLKPGSAPRAPKAKVQEPPAP